MRNLSIPSFGFESMTTRAGGLATMAKLQKVGMGAVKRRFSPEFVNRIDAVVTYQPLGRDSLERILDHQIASLNRHIRDRLAEDVFQVELSADARAVLLERGTSVEYGARELKRTILRMLTQPLAALIEKRGEQRQVPAGCVVRADRSGDALKLTVLGEDGSN